MTMSDEEMARLAKHIVDAQGPLAGVTPATARETLSNLIRNDRGWGARVNSGEATATREFQQLVKMSADHQVATGKAEVAAATAAWDKEQADRVAAKLTEDQKIKTGVQTALRAGTGQS